MKNLILPCVLTTIAVAASADEKVVIRDTRAYLMQNGEKMLFNGEPAAIGGELLTRSGGWCDRTVYEGSSTLPKAPSNGAVSIVMPQIRTTVQNFPCDGAGKPV
ncbi:hypothetical protein [Paraburkholderia sp. SIMBA_054]|uniref:hypothetical protein n=1 Tax=Paraburkholderia sp. SIMBA_054 TaxID=3085795 RepID=UPI00397D6516